MPFAMPSYPTLLQARTFTSTSRTMGSGAKMLKRLHQDIPPYPYGPSPIYKQSNFGLYGNQKIRYGNTVSEKNEIKNRRSWRPNVHSKRLWSDSLGHFVRTRITTRVLRTVDKVGGLDEYLLGGKSARIKELGMAGWRLRWRIMQTDRVKERFRKERAAMGLPPAEEELTGSDGELSTAARVQEEVEAIDRDLQSGEEVAVGEEAEGIFMHEEQGKQEKTIV